MVAGLEFFGSLVHRQQRGVSGTADAAAHVTSRYSLQNIKPQAC